MESQENNWLFHRLGFFQQTTLSLNANRDTFMKAFGECVGDNVNFFGLSNHEKKFHGELKNKTFKMYKPIRMINNTSIACGSGSYGERDGSLQIDLAVFIPVHTFLIFYCLLTTIAVIIIAVMITNQTPLFLLIGFSFFIVFFYFWIYWIFRKNVVELFNVCVKEMTEWPAKYPQAK